MRAITVVELEPMALNDRMFKLLLLSRTATARVVLIPIHGL